MKRLVIHSLVLAMAAIFSPLAKAQGAVYSFELDTPNTAADGDGNVIQVTGAGKFDTSGTVHATGSFSISSSTGALIARGIWRATDFDEFLPFGGPAPGFQGGVLEITVTLFPAGDAPVTGLPMKIVCHINAPPGFTDPEGTTVGPFTEVTGGLTLFNLHQGQP